MSDESTPTGRKKLPWIPPWQSARRFDPPDPKAIKAMEEGFMQGKDIHRQRAAVHFGIPEDQVTDEQRKVGKQLNFYLLYGRNVKTLSEALNHSMNFAIQAQNAPLPCEVVVKRKKGSDWFTADRVEDGTHLRSIIGRASFKLADYDTVLAKLGEVGWGLLSYDENEGEL